MRRVPLIALVVLGFACARNPNDRPSSTIIYNARTRPAATATTRQTLYSTGFVDNTGSTSEQRVRTEASGMRASETGSERPTGTPGSGTPIPIGVPAPDPQIGEGAGQLGGDELGATGAPGDTVVGRIASARCDREMVCGRIGPGNPLETNAQCMSAVRERARAEVVASDCGRGFDPTQLGICLNSIRQLSCDTPLEWVPTLAHCQRSALCSL